MASVKTITLPDGSSYDFKATYDIEGNNISETYINKNEKGAASGVAPLNSSGKIDESYLPSSDFVSESGSFVQFDYSKADVPFSSLKVKINAVQLGSGDPSPSNIREIIGYDSASAIVTGKNMAPQFVSGRSVSITTGDNSGTASDGTSINCATEEFIPVNFKATNYVIGYDVANLPATPSCQIFCYDANKNYLGKSVSSASNPRDLSTNLTPNDASPFNHEEVCYIKVRYYFASGSGNTWTQAMCDGAHFRMNPGGTLNDYVAYEAPDIYTSDFSNIDTFSPLLELGNFSGSDIWSLTQNDSTTIARSSILTDIKACTITSKYSDLRLTLFYTDTNPQTGSTYVQDYGTLTVPVSAKYARLRIQVASSTTSISSLVGELDDLITIDYTDSYIVYGGSLDVINGKLSVTRKMYEFTSATTYTPVQSSGGIWYISQPNEDAVKADDLSLISNIYTNVADSTEGAVVDECVRTTSDSVLVYDNRFTSSSAVASILSENSIQVLCNLMNPIIYQLTQAEVTTLLGQNNVWSDAGDVEVAILPTEISNYIKGLALVVSQDSTSGELTLS